MADVANLENIHVQAIIKGGRKREEVVDLNYHQTETLMKCSTLKRDDVLNLDLHHLWALEKGRNREEILGLNSVQTVALVKHKKLARADVEGLDQEQIDLVATGARKRDEVIGLSKNQLEALKKFKHLQRDTVLGIDQEYRLEALGSLNLTREQVMNKEFSEAHSRAMQWHGFQYDEVIRYSSSGFASDSALQQFIDFWKGTNKFILHYQTAREKEKEKTRADKGDQKEGAKPAAALTSAPGKPSAYT